MRIGVNARILINANLEGIHRYIYETTLEMAKTHPDDEFILFFDRKTNTDFGFPPNVKSVIVPWHARHPILWIWWFEIMLPIYFWWYKIDVFYSGDGYLSLRTTVPTVMVIHDLAYIHYPAHQDKKSLGFYEKYVPKYLQKASKIITVSAYVKGDLIHQFGLPSDKIEVATNAVSPPMDLSDKKLPHDIDQLILDKPYFLYVGAIHPRKNILKLIEGFHIFNKQNNEKYNLVLAGRLAWKTDEIRTAISSSDHIIHVGIVTEETKYLLIRDAVALTYISVFEGFGIPVLEAMKMGTPVITSDVTSLPEVAGDAALLVDPDDIADIANALDKIANDHTVSTDLSHKGLKRYKAFSWVTSSDIIYKSLIASLVTEEKK